MEPGRDWLARDTLRQCRHKQKQRHKCWKQVHTHTGALRQGKGRHTSQTYISTDTPHTHRALKTVPDQRLHELPLCILPSPYLMVLALPILPFKVAFPLFFICVSAISSTCIPAIPQSPSMSLCVFFLLEEYHSLASLSCNKSLVKVFCRKTPLSILFLGLLFLLSSFVKCVPVCVCVCYCLWCLCCVLLMFVTEIVWMYVVFSVCRGRFINVLSHPFLCVTYICIESTILGWWRWTATCCPSPSSCPCCLACLFGPVRWLSGRVSLKHAWTMMRTLTQELRWVHCGVLSCLPTWSHTLSNCLFPWWWHVLEHCFCLDYCRVVGLCKGNLPPPSPFPIVLCCSLSI